MNDNDGPIHVEKHYGLDIAPQRVESYQEAIAPPPRRVILAAIALGISLAMIALGLIGFAFSGYFPPTP